MILYPLIGLLALFVLWLLWRKLKPQTPEQIAVEQAEAGVSSIKKILVPVRGEPYHERAVELACRLGRSQKAEIVVCSVLVVPLAQPLSTCMAADEKIAQDSLARAEKIVEHHGMKAHARIERERDVARGVLKVVQELEVDGVVLGVNPKRLAAGEAVGTATQELLRKSHVEVIVDMHPEDERQS